MSKDKLYYFAHPYTVKDKKGNNIHAGEEANFNLCCIRSVELLKRGYMIYAPVVHTHPMHIRSPEFLAKSEYELYMKLDGKIGEACKGIILGPGWHVSSGCKREHEDFKKRGLEVLLYEDIVKDNKIVIADTERDEMLRGGKK